VPILAKRDGAPPPRFSRVIAAHGRRGLLEVDGERHRFIVKGRALRVVCGDRVQFERRPGSESCLITAIAPRSNELARQPAHGEHPEVIAANLTRLLAVCATRPQADLFLLDRYLCAAELMDCEAAVIWNKSDLAPPASELQLYTALGYPVHGVCTHTGAGMVALQSTLAAGVTVLVGQSGVGKSSLVNALVPGADVNVGELTAGEISGTHTTTAVLMYTLSDGGRLVDAPGVRDFLPALDAGRRLDAGFREIHALAAGCRFGDCRHLQEPGCQVKAGLRDGALSTRRYQSYRQLLESLT
jgi:ribosome biogenesis GTPase / thiamine phosphate phosphatase